MHAEYFTQNTLQKKMIKDSISISNAQSTLVFLAVITKAQDYLFRCIHISLDWSKHSFETILALSTVTLQALSRSRKELQYSQFDMSQMIKTVFKTTIFCPLNLAVDSPLGQRAFPKITLKWTVSVNTSRHITKSQSRMLM